MFKTRLEVAHESGKTWRLLRPLVWEGDWQYIIVRSGFETDFASIPKPVRWLLDNSGENAEAAVLHDAVWRESQRPDTRIDPWHADGLFRRALRETGSSALTRSLMWFAVRAVAMVRSRFGRQGPSLARKVLQLLGVFVLGCLTALLPTLVAAGGLVVYWVGNWIVAVAWHPAERKRGWQTNWPWPHRLPTPTTTPPGEGLLVIVDKARDPKTKGSSAPSGSEVQVANKVAELLANGPDFSEADLDAALA